MAKACSYPQWFAQVSLGHSSRTVHDAYAKGALVIVPPLDEYELIPLSAVRGCSSTWTFRRGSAPYLLHDVLHFFLDWAIGDDAPIIRGAKHL